MVVPMVWYGSKEAGLMHCYFWRLGCGFFSTSATDQKATSINLNLNAMCDSEHPSSFVERSMNEAHHDRAALSA